VTSLKRVRESIIYRIILEDQVKEATEMGMQLGDATHVKAIAASNTGDALLNYSHAAHHHIHTGSHCTPNKQCIFLINY